MISYIIPSSFKYIKLDTNNIEAIKSFCVEPVKSVEILKSCTEHILCEEVPTQMMKTYSEGVYWFSAESEFHGKVVGYFFFWDLEWIEDLLTKSKTSTISFKEEMKKRSERYNEKIMASQKQ